MDEYIDYYMEHCLDVVNRNVKKSTGETDVLEERIILNNIRAIDYKQALSYVSQIVIGDKKEKLLLSKDVFVKDLTLQRYLGNLDAEKLWKLSVLLYSMVMGYPVAEISLTVADEYLQLFNGLHNGLDVSTIEFKGKLNGKSKKISITNDKLLAKILFYYLELHDEIAIEENFKYYTVKRFTTIKELMTRKPRILNYYFAKELESFLISYLNGKFGVNERKLVLQILYLFGRFQNNPPVGTDNYRKLMADSKILQIDKPLIIINGELAPFTIISDKEIKKIRQEYVDWLACES
jgi:hypothetical protein